MQFVLILKKEKAQIMQYRSIACNEKGLAIVAGFGKRQAGNESKIKKLKLMLQINAP